MTCCRCHAAPALDGQTYCKPCRAAYMREYRRAKREGTRKARPLTWEARLKRWARLGA